MAERLVISMNDEERAELEAVRVSMGLRSWAETVRALISGATLDDLSEDSPVQKAPPGSKTEKALAAAAGKGLPLDVAAKIPLKEGRLIEPDRDTGRGWGFTRKGKKS